MIGALVFASSQAGTPPTGALSPFVEAVVTAIVSGLFVLFGSAAWLNRRNLGRVSLAQIRHVDAQVEQAHADAASAITDAAVRVMQEAEKARLIAVQERSAAIEQRDTCSRELLETQTQAHVLEAQRDIAVGYINLMHAVAIADTRTIFPPIPEELEGLFSR